MNPERSERKYLNRAGRFTGTVKTPGNGWIGKTENGTAFVRVPVVVNDGSEQVEAVWRGYLTDNAFDHTAKSLADALGWDGNLSDLAQGDVDWEGVQVSIVTEMETFDGEIRCKVRWLNALRSGAAQIEEDAVEDLLARFGRRGTAIARAVAAEKSRAGTAPKKALAEKPEELADDDIPF